MRSGAKVGIVLVSHSVALAEGAAELAAQISGGEVTIVAAGGTDDGRVGEDDPRLDPRWTPTRPPLAGPAASARAAGPVGWSPAGQRCATEMRGGEALGHDHAPCVVTNSRISATLSAAMRVSIQLKRWSLGRVRKNLAGSAAISASRSSRGKPKPMIVSSGEIAT